MSTGVKRQRQSTTSDAAPPKKKRAPVRKVPSAPRPYKFEFGKHRGKTIEQVHKTDFDYIETYIVMGHWLGKHDHIIKRPKLRAALRNLPQAYLDRHPRLERFLEMEQPGAINIFEYEAETDKGTVKMNERSSFQRCWEAVNSAAVVSSHADAQKLTLDDCKDTFDDSRFTEQSDPINLAFTATVTRIVRSLSEFGNEGGDTITILPCGWPWGTVLKDDFELKVTGQDGTFDTDPGSPVVRIGDLKDPETVQPKQGCCFRMVGKVVKVDGKKVVVCVKKEAGPIDKGWQKEVAVQLVDGVKEPEPGASYVFKGSLEPFLNVGKVKSFLDVFKHTKFVVEVCEKMGET